jgi:hypothetical protein
MPTQILIKKSTTASAVPTTSDITTGELAVNTADKRLFTNNSGTIVELGINPSSVTTGAITASSGTVSGNWSVSGTLTVATPSNDTDAASKAYVDTAVSNVVDSAPGALDTLNELAAALGDDANFSTTITNSLATKLNLSGGTMTGDIVLGANKITSTATPATDDTLTRKGYVDSILGSATDAATSAANAATSESNAATSETNAATSASNASTSETNAATSETNAGNSATSASNSASAASTSASNAATSETNALNAYDSFDDRYLGAKASAPTLDNDGDALIAGALYFNTTDDKMQVYSGSAWGDVAPVATSVTEAQISDLGTTIVLDSDIGVTVQAYDADNAVTDAAQTFTASQRGTVTTDNDLSFDMNVTNFFKCTPTGNGTLTFTNITTGQSGNIWLDNSGGHTISAASTTYIASADLTTISTAGVYFLSYYSDGTNVMVSATPAVTSAGA